MLAPFSTEASFMNAALSQNAPIRARHVGSPSAASFSGISSRENSNHGSDAAKMAESFFKVKRVSGR